MFAVFNRQSISSKQRRQSTNLMTRVWIAATIFAVWLLLFVILAMPTGGQGLLVATSLHLRSFAVLIGVRSSVEDQVEFEFRRVLRHNPRLGMADPIVMAEHRSTIRDNTLHRFRLLRRALGYSFLTILSACFASVAVVVFSFNRSLSSLFSLRAVCTMASMFAFGWATLGRLGCAGQSLGGETVVEMLDELLFPLLYALAAFLGTAAVLL